MIGLTSCNSDDDSNLQPKTFESEVNAKELDNVNVLGTFKVQSAISTNSNSREEEVLDDTGGREKTFPCKSWECVQIAD